MPNDFDVSKWPKYSDVIKAYKDEQGTPRNLPDITIAAVTAAASAAAAAAASAVIAAAGKDVEERLQEAPPLVFPFYGLPPNALRTMSNPTAIQASIQAAIANTLPQSLLGKMNPSMQQTMGVTMNQAALDRQQRVFGHERTSFARGENYERTGTSEPGCQQRPSQVHGEDGEDSACSRENEMQVKTALPDQEAEGRYPTSVPCMNSLPDLMTRQLQQQKQQQQNSNGSNLVSRILNPYSSWSVPSAQPLSGGILMPPSSMWTPQLSEPSSVGIVNRLAGSEGLRSLPNTNNGNGKSINGSVKAPGNGTSGSGGSGNSAPTAGQNPAVMTGTEGVMKLTGLDDNNSKHEQVEVLDGQLPIEKDHNRIGTYEQKSQAEKGPFEQPSDMMYPVSKQQDEQNRQSIRLRETLQRSSMERESKTDMNSGSSGDDGIRSVGLTKEQQTLGNLVKDNPEGSGSNPTGNGSSIHGSTHPSSQRNYNGTNANVSSSRLQSTFGNLTSSSGVTTKARYDLPPPLPVNLVQPSRRSGSGKGSGGEEEAGAGGSGGNGSGGNGSGGNHSTANANERTYWNQYPRKEDQAGDTCNQNLHRRAKMDALDNINTDEGQDCNTEIEQENRVEASTGDKEHKRKRMEKYDCPAEERNDRVAQKSRREELPNNAHCHALKAAMDALHMVRTREPAASHSIICLCKSTNLFIDKTKSLENLI